MHCKSSCDNTPPHVIISPYAKCPHKIKRCFTLHGGVRWTFASFSGSYAPESTGIKTENLVEVVLFDLKPTTPSDF